MFFFIILLYQIGINIPAQNRLISAEQFNSLHVSAYEKEHKLRLGMRMMGLKGWVYWAAWFIHSQVINIISTLLLIATGMACDFAFFRSTNFFVLFIVFWIFGWVMSHLAFLVATLISTTKLAVLSFPVSPCSFLLTHGLLCQVYMSMMIFIVGALLMLIFSLFGSFMFPLYAIQYLPPTALKLTIDQSLRGWANCYSVPLGAHVCTHV